MNNQRGWVGIGAFILGLVIWGFEKFYFKDNVNIGLFIVGFGMGLISIGFKE